MGNENSSGMTHHRDSGSRRKGKTNRKSNAKHPQPSPTGTTATATTTTTSNNNNNNNTNVKDDRMDTTPIEDSSSAEGDVRQNTHNQNTTSTTPKVVTMDPGESCQTFTGGEQATQPAWKQKLHTKQTNGVGCITDALTDVRENYHINPKEIGHGHYGVVRKCMHRQTKQWYAIKSIRKSKVGKVEVLKREIQILQEMKHPNIIELKEVHEDKKYLHLITELCTGGELFDRIIAKTQSPEGHFSEYDAAVLIYDILDAIAYCHDEKGIVHRDLKPENFLFATDDEHSKIKIIDFGLSRHDSLQHGGIMKTKVGTPYYVAPEVLNREYTKSCDIWSIGVITYILLCGYPPFYGDSDNEIFNSVRTGKFDFPSPEWDDISAAAKQFIRTLLRKKPHERLTASEAKQHVWLVEQLGPLPHDQEKQNDADKQNHQGNSHDAIHDETTTPNGGNPNDTENKNNASDIRPRRRSSSIILLDSDRSQTYQKYRGMQKLKKIALAHIASHLTKAEVGELGDIFQNMDQDHDGTVTLQDLDAALAQATSSSSSTARTEKKSSLIQGLEDLRTELQLCDQSTFNWKEFLAATMDKTIALREDKIRLAFDHFRHNDTATTTLSTKDTNPDNNCISVQDLIELFGGESQAKEIMGFVDLDGDGRISFEEFRNAIQESMVMDDHDMTTTATNTKNDVTPPTSNHHG